MTATASSDVAAVMERAKLSGPNKPVSPLDTRNVNEPGQAGHRPTSPDEVSPLTKSDQDTLTEDEPVSDLGAGPRGEGVGGRGSAMLSGSSSQNGAVLSPKTREQSAGGFPPEWLVEIKKIIKDEIGQLQQNLQRGTGDDGTGQIPTKPAPTSSVVDNTSPTSRTARPFESASVMTSSFLGQSSDGSVSPLQMSMLQQPPQSPGSSPSLKTFAVRFNDTGPRPVNLRRAGPGSNTSPIAGFNIEPSVTDERWGLLFDNQGYPTQRLGQVLKGLANYIIEEFMPQRSIVVTPTKLAAFYSFYRLEPEVFPHVALFSNTEKDANGRIADLFQDLGCAYHLVQADAKSRPAIPGLTPAGFAQWLISNILAYPDEEARRLDKAFCALSISADGGGASLGRPGERLPQQLPRRLLPDRPDLKSRRLLDEAMQDLIEEIHSPDLPPMYAFPSLADKAGSARRSTVASPGTAYQAVRPTAAPAPSPAPGSGSSSRYPPSSNPVSPPKTTPVVPRRTYSDGTARLPEHSKTYMPPPPVGPHHASTSAASPPASAASRRSVPPPVRYGPGAEGGGASLYGPGPLSGSSSRSPSLSPTFGPDEYGAGYAQRPGGDRPGTAGGGAGARRSSGLPGAGPTWDEFLSGRNGGGGGGSRASAREGSYQSFG